LEKWIQLAITVLKDQTPGTVSVGSEMPVQDKPAEVKMANNPDDKKDAESLKLEQLTRHVEELKQQLKAIAPAPAPARQSAADRSGEGRR
jgi:hypothetical protein